MARGGVVGWLRTARLANASVGTGQLLGAAQTISAGKILNVSGTTTINAGGTLVVSTPNALETTHVDQVEAEGSRARGLQALGRVTFG